MATAINMAKGYIALSAFCQVDVHEGEVSIEVEPDFSAFNIDPMTGNIVLSPKYSHVDMSPLAITLEKSKCGKDKEQQTGINLSDLVDLIEDMKCPPEPQRFIPFTRAAIDYGLENGYIEVRDDKMYYGGLEVIEIPRFIGYE